MLVISLGVLLIGGTFLLGVLMWKKGFEGAHCAGMPVNLKGHGPVISSQIQGKKLYLTLKRNGGGAELVTVDICSGAVLSNLAIDTDIK